MTFLNPLFLLAGLIACGVPIIIHLLNKRKFDRTPWAAMQFLQLSVEQNKSRMKLEDLLLLCLRIGLILLLAMALARPTQRLAQAGKLFGQSRVSATILLDNSYSMGQSDGVTTRFDQARRLATDVIDALPSDSSVCVFLVSDIVDKLVRDPTHDLNFARQAVAQARLSDRTTQLRTALQEAINQPRKEQTRREIYLITDGQASAFAPTEQTIALLQSVSNQMQVHVLLAGSSEKNNLAVSDLRADAQIPAVNVRQSFVAKVTNFGSQTVTHVQISLAIDQLPYSDQALIETILPGESQSISLSARFTDAGYHTVTASIPHDHLAADDQRTIALHVVKGVNVLLVDGAQTSAAIESPTYFVEQALLAAPPEQLKNFPLHRSRVTASTLSQAVLADQDFIVLADVADLEPRAIDNLRRFVERGGGLLILPGPHTRTLFYNDALLKSGLLAAKLGSLSQQQVSIDAKMLSHPVASLWGDAASGNLGAVTFSHWFDLQPLPGSDAILRLTSGSPAFIEKPLGMGRVILSASSASTDWTNLPLAAGGGIWPPLINRLTAWAVCERDAMINIRVGQPLLLPVPLAWDHRSASISENGGQSRPSGQTTAFAIGEVDAQPTLRVDDTSAAGGYLARVSPDIPALAYAVQSEASESDLTPLNGQQLARLADAASITPSGADPRLAIDRTRLGGELWVTFATIVFSLGLVETLLADWFSRAK